MQDLKKLLLLFGVLGVLCIACGDDDPEPGENPDPMDVCAYDTFDLVGEWDLKKVNVSSIFGPSEDTMPSGGIQFLADGTGVSSFVFNAYNNSIDFDNDTITYVIDFSKDPPEDVEVTQSDGTVVAWSLKDHENCKVTASFEYNFDVATADLEVELEKK